MKYFACVVFFISTLLIASEELKISKINLKKHLIAIKLSVGTELEKGDELILTADDKRQCTIKVRKIRKKYAIAKTNLCAFEDELKVGQSVEISIFGEDDDKDKDKNVKNGKAGYEFKSMSKVEKWYYYLSLGPAFGINYEGEIQDGIESIKAIEDSKAEYINLAIEFNFLGFYWPMKNKKTIVGISYNSMFDMHTGEDRDSTITITASTWALSTLHFFGKVPGEGLFLRFDAGISSVQYEIENKDLGLKHSENATGGYGGTVGMGYGFSISNGTRFLMGLNYSYVDTSLATISWGTAHCGFLF